LIPKENLLAILANNSLLKYNTANGCKSPFGELEVEG
jgi:hypothetical protein